MGGTIAGCSYPTYLSYVPQPVLIKRSIAAPRASPSSPDFSGLRGLQLAIEWSARAPKYALCFSRKYMNIVEFKRMGRKELFERTSEVEWRWVKQRRCGE